MTGRGGLAAPTTAAAGPVRQGEEGKSSSRQLEATDTVLGDDGEVSCNKLTGTDMLAVEGLNDY